MDLISKRKLGVLLVVLFSLSALSLAGTAPPLGNWAAAPSYTPRREAKISALGDASNPVPFIASARLPEATVALVREALFEALGDPAVAEARATLGLKSARPTTPSDYDRVLEIERGAEAEGYPRLA